MVREEERLFVEERWFVSYLLVVFFSFFFCNHAFIVLGTKSLMQR